MGTIENRLSAAETWKMSGTGMNPWLPFNDVAMPKFSISHEPMLGPVTIGIITKNISLTP